MELQLLARDCEIKYFYMQIGFARGQLNIFTQFAQYNKDLYTVLY